MEQPSFTCIASQSVDYLGQIYNWTDTEAVSSYEEICRQLDICQREKREQKGHNKLRKSSPHFKQLSQRTAQISSQSQQSQRGGNNNDFTIGNVGKQLKQKKEDPALRAEGKRSEIALWRRMDPLVGCDEKANKLEILKW
jgi:hypothetical protein